MPSLPVIVDVRKEVQLFLEDLNRDLLQRVDADGSGLRTELDRVDSGPDETFTERVVVFNDERVREVSPSRDVFLQHGAGAVFPAKKPVCVLANDTNAAQAFVLELRSFYYEQCEQMF